MGEAEQINLVPGRECGECAVCCTDLLIDTRELKKAAGVRCGHCPASGGCSIYDTRPQVCRNFYCLWRQIPSLEDSWRPDRCGILMRPVKLPAGFSGEIAIEFHLLGKPDILETNEFAGLVGVYIDHGIALFLAVPKELGVTHAQAFLNPILGDAIAARNLAEVKALVRTIYQRLCAGPIPAE